MNDVDMHLMQASLSLAALTNILASYPDDTPLEHLTGTELYFLLSPIANEVQQARDKFLKI